MLRDKGNMRRGQIHNLSGGPFLRLVGRGQGGGVEGAMVGLRAWLILGKMYTCTCTKLIFS